jgi:hypothetical protein
VLPSPIENKIPCHFLYLKKAKISLCTLYSCTESMHEKITNNMNQGPRGDCLMIKTEGQKSWGTVLLRYTAFLLMLSPVTHSTF